MLKISFREFGISFKNAIILEGYPYDE